MRVVVDDQDAAFEGGHGSHFLVDPKCKMCKTIIRRLLHLRIFRLCAIVFGSGCRPGQTGMENATKNTTTCRTVGSSIDPSQGAIPAFPVRAGALRRHLQMETHMKLTNIRVSTLAAAIRLCLATLAASLAGGTAAMAAAPDTTRVVVAFKPGAAAAVKAAVGMARGRVKLRHRRHERDGDRDSRRRRAGAAPQPERRLRRRGRQALPARARHAVQRQPYLPGQLVPYGIKMVQADQLPDTCAANRMVCIIDSGYDRAHEDLSGNSASGDLRRRHRLVVHRREPPRHPRGRHHRRASTTAAPAWSACTPTASSSCTSSRCSAPTAGPTRRRWPRPPTSAATPAPT